MDISSFLTAQFKKISWFVLGQINDIIRKQIPGIYQSINGVIFLDLKNDGNSVKNINNCVSINW
jgi:uncharacterized protein involved in cysteine biosynthesis